MKRIPSLTTGEDPLARGRRTASASSGRSLIISRPILAASLPPASTATLPSPKRNIGSRRCRRNSCLCRRDARNFGRFAPERGGRACLTRAMKSPSRCSARRRWPGRRKACWRSDSTVAQPSQSCPRRVRTIILGSAELGLAQGVHGRTFVLRVRRRSRPSSICLTEAGIAGGKMGVNDRGIGLVENGLASSHDGRDPYQKRFPMRCREILDAETWKMRTPRYWHATHLLCEFRHRLGQGPGRLSRGQSRSCRRGAATGRRAHALQSFSDTGSRRVSDGEAFPNTLHRVNRMRQLLRRDRGAISFEHMRAAAADDNGAPYAI